VFIALLVGVIVAVADAVAAATRLPTDSAGSDPVGWSVVIAGVAGIAAVASAVNSHRTAKVSREALRTNRRGLERAYRPLLAPNDEKSPIASARLFEADFQNVGSGAALNVTGSIVTMRDETDGRVVALGKTLRPIHLGSGQVRRIVLRAEDDRSLRGDPFGNPHWRLLLTYEDEAGTPHWSEARFSQRGGGGDVQIGQGFRPPLWVQDPR